MGTPFNGYCYKVVDVDEDWNTAEEYCNQLQSHLVSVHSTTENYFLGNLMYEYGVYDIHLGGFLIGPGGEDIDNWKWSDDTSWDYAYWDDSYPKSYNSSCLYLGYNGKPAFRWRNSLCTNKHAFVCR